MKSRGKEGGTSFVAQKRGSWNWILNGESALEIFVRCCYPVLDARDSFEARQWDTRFLSRSKPLSSCKNFE